MKKYKITVSLDETGYDHTMSITDTLDVALSALERDYAVNKDFWPNNDQRHMLVELYRDEEDEPIAGYDTSRKTKNESRDYEDYVNRIPAFRFGF